MQIRMNKLNQAYQCKITEPSLPDQVNQTKHNKSNPTNQTYQIKLTKSNQPKQTCQTKHTKLNQFFSIDFDFSIGLT